MANAPTRRAFVGSSTTAALVAASTAALAATDPDAALLTLRPRWLAIRAAMDANHAPRSLADQPAYRAGLAALPRPSEATSFAEYERRHAKRYEAIRGLLRAMEQTLEAVRRQDEHTFSLCDAEDAIIAVLVATPARTAAGLAFKAEAYLADEASSDKLAVSIALDAMTLARAGPATGA